MDHCAGVWMETKRSKSLDGSVEPFLLIPRLIINERSEGRKFFNPTKEGIHHGSSDECDVYAVTGGGSHTDELDLA